MSLSSYQPNASSPFQSTAMDSLKTRYEKPKRELHFPVNQKNIIVSFLGVAVLAAGLLAGVMLVGTSQDTATQAAVGDIYLTFSNDADQPFSKTITLPVDTSTTSQTLDLFLNHEDVEKRLTALEVRIESSQTIEDVSFTTTPPNASVNSPLFDEILLSPSISNGNTISFTLGVHCDENGCPVVSNHSSFQKIGELTVTWGSVEAMTVNSTLQISTQSKAAALSTSDQVIDGDVFATSVGEQHGQAALVLNSQNQACQGYCKSECLHANYIDGTDLGGNVQADVINILDLSKLASSYVGGTTPAQGSYGILDLARLAKYYNTSCNDYE